MKKETRIGLLFITISLVLPRIVNLIPQVINGNTNEAFFANISSFIQGLTTGLGLCFIVIGLLPQETYNALKKK